MQRPNSRSVFIVIVGVALLICGRIYLWSLGKETTDDAQVEGRLVNISPRIPGQISKIHVRDFQQVTAGDLLIELDSEDWRARFEAAKADVGSAAATLSAAQVQLNLTMRMTDASLRQAGGGVAEASSVLANSQAAADQAKAGVAVTASKLRLAELEFQRSKSLFAQHAVAQAELDSRQVQLDAARAEHEQAEALLKSRMAAITGSAGTVQQAYGKLNAAETGPTQVQNARAAVDLAGARLRQAEAAMRLADLNLRHTQIKAPTSGVVTRRTAEMGAMVNPERPIISIVPLDDIWVIANFKETQLAQIRHGQRAEIKVDAFQNHLIHGQVESVAGMTGSRASLLPPENASGNFVKVVQRVPVLIRIDNFDGVVLRPGLNADVTVFTK